MTSAPDVEITSKQEAFPFDLNWLRDLTLRALQVRRSNLRLSLVLVDDAEISQIHGDFLNDGSETDVITFDLRDPEDPTEVQQAGFSAELVISAERAVREAEKRKISAQHELALYVIHGILHLEGFRDASEEEKKEMRVAEKSLLESLGLPHVF